MTMYRVLIATSVLVLGFGLQGCKTTGSKDGVEVVDGSQDGATSYGAGDGSGVGSGPYAGMTEAQLMSNTVFYFDFDQSSIKEEGRPALNAHAEYLRQNPTVRVVLEGHADERGTREYNLALGERRANAIRSYVAAQGAKSSQMESVSYGEEKPATEGHDEYSWSQNRRVELKYTNR